MERGVVVRVLRRVVPVTLLVLLAACAPLPPRVPPPAPQLLLRFHGEAVWRAAQALPAGATLRVRLEEVTASGRRVIAEAGGMVVTHSPQPFALSVPAAQLQVGHYYELHASVLDARDRVLLRQVAPAPVSSDVAAQAVRLWLVAVAPQPRSAAPPVPAAPKPAQPAAPRALPVLSAEGRQPNWSAQIDGIGAGRVLRTAIGDRDPLRQRFAGVRRQRLPSGVVVYLSRDGFTSLTLSAGPCHLPASRHAWPWRATLETPAATYHGCASGIP